MSMLLFMYLVFFIYSIKRSSGSIALLLTVTTIGRPTLNSDNYFRSLRWLLHGSFTVLCCKLSTHFFLIFTLPFIFISKRFLYWEHDEWLSPLNCLESSPRYTNIQRRLGRYSGKHWLIHLFACQSYAILY